MTVFARTFHPATLLCLCCTSAACFFTSGINSEPQAQIETVAPGPYYRGTEVALTAYKSDDPNGDRLEVDWRAFTCSADRSQCDAPAFATLADVRPDQEFRFMVPTTRVANPDEATVIVSVVGTVRDEHGATHEDRLFVDISNRAPTLALQLQGARVEPGMDVFPVGSYVEIWSQVSDPDGDTTRLEWSYQAPNDSAPGDVGWRELADSQAHQLEPDVRGSWSVLVTATDSLGLATDQTVPIYMREDQPPCIASTDPVAIAGARYIVDKNGPARRFSVLRADDDLDSYPRDTRYPFFASTRFRWYLASPDTGGLLAELRDHQEPDYLLQPDLYAVGDRFTLRVEIDDRAGRVPSCGPESATCSVNNDGCVQRLTWEAEIR